MVFQAARCPNCSGELMLDSEKKSGFCNHCGSEIVVKEAISKVQIDQQPIVENLLNIAKDAYDRGDSKEAYDYYSKVLEIDPSQWEALWYRGLSGAWQSSLANIRIIDAIQGSSKAIEILSEKVANSLPENLIIESIKLKNQKIMMAYELHKVTKVLHDKARKHYQEFRSTEGAFDQYWARYDNIFIPTLEYCLTLVEDEISEAEIESLADDADTLKLAQETQKLANIFKPKLLQDGLDYCMTVSKNSQGMIDAYKADGLVNPYIRFSNAMKKIDPNHETNIKKEGSCYIATTVYGDYDAPEVKVLRSFRDEKLLKTDAGRLFVSGYYSVGPVLAKTVARQPLLNGYVRRVLNKMVKSIQK